MQMLHEKTGKSTAEIAVGYTILRNVYGLRGMWADIEKLEGKINSDTLTELYTRISKMIERAMPWYVTHANEKNMESIITTHSNAVASIRKWMGGHGEKIINRDENEQYTSDLRSAGVPAKIIHDVFCLPVLAHIPEIVSLAEKTGRSIENVAEIYFALEDRLRLFWLRTKARDLSSENVWQREASANLIDDLYIMQSTLTSMILQGHTKAKSAKQKKMAQPSVVQLVDTWATSKTDTLQQYTTMLSEIANARHADFAMLNLALRHLQHLAYKG